MYRRQQRFIAKEDKADDVEQQSDRIELEPKNEPITTSVTEVGGLLPLSSREPSREPSRDGSQIGPLVSPRCQL